MHRAAKPDIIGDTRSACTPTVCSSRGWRAFAHHIVMARCSQDKALPFCAKLFLHFKQNVMSKIDARAARERQNQSPRDGVKQRLALCAAAPRPLSKRFI